MMKKTIMLLAIIATAAVFAACSETVTPNRAEYYQPLTINVTRPLNRGHDRSTRFWHDLTYEEISAVLPSFENFAKIRSSIAEYRADNSLRRVTVEIERPDEPNFRTTVTIQRDSEYIGESFSDWVYYYFKGIRGFTISDVQGVAVVAERINLLRPNGTYERDAYDPIQLYEFVAAFALDGIVYRITLFDHPCFTEYNEREYNKWLELLVNEIILTNVMDGLIADLSVLDNPEIPELRDERITIEQARADPDFGAYIPKNMPEGLEVSSARRFINQTSNWLRVNYSYHYSHRSGPISWQIGEPMVHHFDRLVSLDEREKYDMSLYPPPWASTIPRELRQVVQNPTFRAEDMSFDVVMARAYRHFDDEHMSTRSFAVLIAGIVIDISPHRMTPEEVWEILEQVLSQ